MSAFFDLAKRARYEELSARLREPLSASWDWGRLRALIRELGVEDPYGFLAAGWWLPVQARLDPSQVEHYGAEAERAIAEGYLPSPDQRYTWDDVRRLLVRCGIRASDVVRGLLWVYAGTLAEGTFLDALRRVPADVRDPDQG